MDMISPTPSHPFMEVRGIHTLTFFFLSYIYYFHPVCTLYNVQCTLYHNYFIFPQIQKDDNTTFIYLSMLFPINFSYFLLSIYFIIFNIFKSCFSIYFPVFHFSPTLLFLFSIFFLSSHYPVPSLVLCSHFLYFYFHILRIFSVYFPIFFKLIYSCGLRGGGVQERHPPWKTEKMMDLVLLLKFFYFH